MNAKAIKKLRILLIEKDLNQSKLASLLNISNGMLSLVLHGHRKAPHIRQTIAQMMGEKPEDLWQ